MMQISADTVGGTDRKMIVVDFVIANEDMNVVNKRGCALGRMRNKSRDESKGDYSFEGGDNTLISLLR